MKKIHLHIAVGCMLVYLVFSCIPINFTQESPMKLVSIIDEPNSEDITEYDFLEPVGHPSPEKLLTPEKKTVIEYNPKTQVETIQSKVIKK